jgi:hypothetical protein
MAFPFSFFYFIAINRYETKILVVDAPKELDRAVEHREADRWLIILYATRSFSSRLLIVFCNISKPWELAIKSGRNGVDV